MQAFSSAQSGASRLPGHDSPGDTRVLDGQLPLLFETRALPNATNANATNACLFAWFFFIIVSGIGGVAGVACVAGGAGYIESI